MDILRSGDTVEYASPTGPQHGQIQDVRGSGSAAVVTFTYIVVLDGVRDPIAVTDSSKLTKVDH